MGDAVNLTQRLQQWAEPGETVLSEKTWQSLSCALDAEELEPALVKGRDTLVKAFKLPASAANVEVEL